MIKKIISIFFLLLLFSSCDIGCIGTPDNNEEFSIEAYYSSATGLTGDALKAGLHEIIHGHTVIGYGDLWEVLSETDRDPENPNNVILLYKQTSQSNTTHGGNVNDWNREHVWAKSRGNFGKSMGAGSDIHHLRPTDASVNQNRGHLDFDEVDNGGSRHTEATDCYYDHDSWEPPDEVKGDIARMLFYMAVRYEGCQADKDDPDITVCVDLELDEAVKKDSKEPSIGKLSVLLEWHKNDPVSDFERTRNNIIFEKYQHNRNPFIDHPEFVELIW